MSRQFSRKFYNSKEWKKCRDYIYKRDNGVCQQCGEPGLEVHHKVFLNPHNIHDPDITLNHELLTLLCRDCHMDIHRKVEVTAEGYAFDANGDLIQA